MNDNLKQREQELEAEALRINAGRKPKFGDLMRNPWASESNPIRDGYFVRKCGAGVDAYYEFTNGNGKFWKTRARFAFFIEAARATPAQPDEWMEAQRICDLPAVDEAIRGFVEDQTGDNAVCVVREVMRATATPSPASDVSAPSPSSVGAAITDAERIRAEVDWENGLTQLLEGYKHAADHGICSRESIQQRIIDYVLALAAPSIAQDGQKSEGA